MPRGDGTGPAGMGSMTGRGLGYCTGYSKQVFTKGFGQGLARGREGERRMVEEIPYNKLFLPNLEEYSLIIILRIEAAEALRLVDKLDLTQERSS